jgi:hypothetical protein
MTWMSRSILFVALTLISLLAEACGESSSESDAGTDTDADADGGSDTDSGEWSWSSVDIPTSMSGHLGDFTLLVVEDDEVYICGGFWNASMGGGGIGWFNGESLAVEIPSAERFTCEGLFESDAAIYAFGWYQDLGTPRVVLREDGEWNEVSVEAADGCMLEAMFETSAGAVTLVGSCAEGRRAWELEGGGFAASEAVLPDNESMFQVLGAFPYGSGNAYYGDGIDTAGDGLFFSDTESALGYPSISARWAASDDTDGVFAVDGPSLLGFDGDTWSEIAGCPEELEAPDTCWRCGARGSDGSIYLGGGTGEGGLVSETPERRRLYRYSGGALVRILEQCDTMAMNCGVDAIAITSARIYAVVRQGGLGELVFADLPE